MESEKKSKWAWEKDEYKKYLDDINTNLVSLLVKSHFEDIKVQNYEEDDDIVNSMVDLLDYILTNGLYWLLKSVIFTGLTADFPDNEDALKYFNNHKTKYIAEINRDRELIKKAVIMELGNRLFLQ